MKLLLKVNSEKTRRRHAFFVENTPTPPARRTIQQNRTNQTSILQKASANPYVFIILILLIVVSVGVTIYLILNKQPPNPEKKEILFGKDYETGTFPNLGNGHLVIDREQWGAQDRSSVSHPLEHPIPYVLITHIGVQSVPCYNVYKCSIKMRTIQDSAVAEKGLSDISANFYVGNDGNVYVGRGWENVNTYANKTLAITFMGDYIRYEPDEKQLEAAQYLIDYGVTQKHIALDYKLVAQNQTKSTRSPGANVYKEIVKWRHWYNCGSEGNPRCGAELGLPDNWDGKM